MKKILLVLLIVTFLISCKKNKLYNCLDGKWYNSSGWIDTITINNGSFSNATGSYNVDKKGNVKKDNASFGHIDCNGSNFIWEYDGFKNIYIKIN